MKAAALCALALFALSTEATARVFLALEKDGQKYPWQDCYTGPVTQAHDDLLAGRFHGGNDSEARGLRVDGLTLRFELWVFGEKYRDVSLSGCPFSDEDLSATVPCEITIQDVGANSVAGVHPVKLTGGYLLSIEKNWKEKGFTTDVIDCGKRRARVIRNSWSQELSVAEIKVMSEIVRTHRKPLIASAIGSVREGGSLDPMQGWSGVVHLNFMENLDSAEVYDASVQQFSVPGELRAWVRDMRGAWAPWGLQMVSFECKGYPKVVDPTALEWVPLDMSSATVKGRCARP